MSNSIVLNESIKYLHILHKDKSIFHVPFLRQPKPWHQSKKKSPRNKQNSKKNQHKRRNKKVYSKEKGIFIGSLSRKSISLFEVGSPVPQSVLTSFFFRKIGRCETLFALTPRDHVVGHRWCNGKLRCIFCFCLLLIRFDLFFALFCHLIESVWSGLCLLCFFLWSLSTEISTKGFVSSRSRGGNSWNH